MKKLLVYSNRDVGTKQWDVSTSASRSEGFVKLFNFLKELHAYEDCPPEGRALKLYDAAIQGNVIAVEQFLKLRKTIENEDWEIEELPENA